MQGPTGGGVTWYQSEQLGAVGGRLCSINRVGCPLVHVEDVIGLFA